MEDEMEEKLRDLLRGEADRVPPRRQVPHRMLRRARRRVALTLAAGFVAVAAIAFGSYTGVQALTGSRALQPIGQNHSPVVSPTPTAARPSPCTGVNLEGTADLQGAAGSRVGSIVVMNRSAGTCVIQGRPDVQFLDGKGRLLPITTSGTLASWQVNVRPKPSGWPVVTLAPGQKALIRTAWSNWCAPLPRTWRILLPAENGSFDIAAFPDAPPCLGPSQPSTLQLGPFEPAS